MSITWLIQTDANLPSGNPADWLSSSEYTRYSALKSAKRRHDWLLGRWTSKCLVQSWCIRELGRHLPAAVISIVSDPDGAPGLKLDPDYADLIPVIAHLQLSISHSGDQAFCVLNDCATVAIGCDIERIEPRSWGFVEDYCTKQELALVRSSAEPQRETLITAIWSAKEAALKALRLGLSVDTRSISCTLAAQMLHWSPVTFICDQQLLGRSSAPTICGWWYPNDDYVLTIAQLS